MLNLKEKLWILLQASVMSLVFSSALAVLMYLLLLLVSIVVDNYLFPTICIIGAVVFLDITIELYKDFITFYQYKPLTGRKK